MRPNSVVLLVSPIDVSRGRDWSVWTSFLEPWERRELVSDVGDNGGAEPFEPVESDLLPRAIVEVGFCVEKAAYWVFEPFELEEPIVDVVLRERVDGVC